MIKNITLSLLFVVLNICSVHSQQSKIPNFISDSLEQYITDAMTKWNIPGMAVGIVKDDSVIMQKGFGFADIKNQTPANENTLFIIASNTKAFTGTLLAMLENEGLCSLNDKVLKWVPNFKMSDPWLTKNANLTDLVTHRLGMETFQGDFMFFYSGLKDEQMYEKFSKLELQKDFRDQYGYCNAGYFFAGKAIENMTGKTWDTVLHEKILNPLKMNRTTTTLDRFEKMDNISLGYSNINYQLQSVPYGRFKVLNPAASICSSVADMNNWTRTLLNSGQFEGKQIIPFNAIKKTRMPETIMDYSGRHPFNKNLFTLYGLGWRIFDYNGYKVTMHGGAVSGFLSNVVLIPELNLGIVVLTNTDHNWFYSILKWEIMDAFMNLPYRDYKNFYYPYYKQQNTKDSIHLAQLIDTVRQKHTPPIPLNEFAGSYTSQVYGTLEIKHKKNDLNITFEHHPELTAKLEYFKDNKFLCTYSNPSHGVVLFPFVIENGKVKSFTLSVAEHLEYTTYEFIKN